MSRNKWIRKLDEIGVDHGLSRVFLHDELLKPALQSLKDHRLVLLHRAADIEELCAHIQKEIDSQQKSCLQGE